jgi:hypothetical protein
MFEFLQFYTTHQCTNEDLVKPIVKIYSQGFQ